MTKEEQNDLLRKYNFDTNIMTKKLHYGSVLKYSEYIKNYFENLEYLNFDKDSTVEKLGEELLWDIRVKDVKGLFEAYGRKANNEDVKQFIKEQNDSFFKDDTDETYFLKQFKEAFEVKRELYLTFKTDIDTFYTKEELATGGLEIKGEPIDKDFYKNENGLCLITNISAKEILDLSKQEKLFLPKGTVVEYNMDLGGVDVDRFEPEADLKTITLNTGREVPNFEIITNNFHQKYRTLEELKNRQLKSQDYEVGNEEGIMPPVPENNYFIMQINKNVDEMFFDIENKNKNKLVAENKVGLARTQKV